MTTTATCRPSCAADLSAAPDTGQVSLRIRRVTTTRAGGVSKPPFDSFNLGDHVGDDPAAVAANRTRLATAIGLALAVVTADCVPVLLADARAGVAAAVHAGRVGAQRGVVMRAVEAMRKLGAQVGDISALLGPAASGRNYEVPAAMAD